MGTIAKESANPRVFRTIMVGLGVCVLGALSTASGCIEQPTQLQPGFTGGGGAGGGGSSGAGPAVENPGRSLFNAMQGDLMTSCGTCHDLAGSADTPFLAGPDRYQSFVSWPGIVASTPEESLLLTHAISGKGHVGTVNLDSPGLVNTLLPKVKAWLAEEAKTFVKPPQQVPHIEPFAPILGFNAVYLEPLGADFKGMAVTFSADLLSDSTLQLTNIEVHPTTKAGIFLVHPLFVMHPVKGEPIPDPGDSFSNIMGDSFEAGESRQLGPGTFVFVNWQKDARLSLAFEKIELLVAPTADAGDGGMDPMGGCKDVASFNTNARPQLQQRCFGCHGGNNGQATAALDMSALQNDATKACAQVKNRVNPMDPPASQIFVTTNPNGNAAHPYKFGGNADTFNAFRTDLVKWIGVE